MWEMKDLPQCGTPSCPLSDLPEDVSPETYAFTQENCICQDPEFIELTRRTPIFFEVMAIWKEMKAGLPPPVDMDDDLRFALTVFDQLIQEARAEFNESKRENKENGSNTGE